MTLLVAVNTALDREFFETLVSGARTNLGRAFKAALAQEPATSLWGTTFTALARRLGEAEAVTVLIRLARFAYLIEAVNRDITSTKFTVRWLQDGSAFFSFGPGDVRWASFQECEAIAAKLLTTLMVDIADDEKRTTLRLCLDHNVIAHELPVDYLDSSPAQQAIHRAANAAWVWSNDISKTVRLRSQLLERTEVRLPVGAPLSDVMGAAISQKICVKTNLTDRAQTGPYQTNREKRWEAHPASVQFASRKSTWAIERELLEQLCFFEGFPTQVQAELIAAGLLPGRALTRCPITLDPLSFADFSREALDPNHGRSKFQVGHLNPLKAVERTAGSAGHTAENIAWISAAGNRIQGDLTLDQARTLVQHIADNYRALL